MESTRRHGKPIVGNLDLFGDQFSNFNVGKILLFIEGLARSFIFRTRSNFKIRDSMPLAWDWMEFRFPYR